MAETFSTQEILRIAVNVENNGEKLYAVLENQAADKRIKELWQYLKVQEQYHCEFFQRMLDNLEDFVVPEYGPGEYAAYLRAIASTYIFTQGLIEEKISQLFNSDMEAVEFGIKIEQESILVYSALKEYMTTDKQPLLNEVIDQEKKHLIDLTLLKAELIRTKG